jgi:hypothetical protein
MLNSKKLGIAAGIIWALGMFICTVLALYTGYSAEFLKLMSTIYPGYTISWLGAFVGLIYGFIDSFTFFFLLGLIYNKLPE